MKNFFKFSKLIQFLIFIFKIENFIIFISKFSSIFTKALPPPNFYKKKTFKKIKRDEVNFYVDISDYMQWYLFANISDNSWLYAYNCLENKSRFNVIDIGSNIGAFTLKLAKKCYENKKEFNIYSFEPNKHIFKTLENNINLNYNLSNHIKYFEKAVGDSNTAVDFLLNKENSGGSRIKNSSSELVSQKNYLTVEQIKLDDFIEINNINFVDFIKIDVEGFEPFVLDGSTNTLEKFKPDLYIEISPRWFKELGRSSVDLLNSLESMGYVIFVDRTHSLRRLNEFDKLPNVEQFNILAKYNNH